MRLIDADAIQKRYKHELSRTYLSDYANGFRSGLDAATGKHVPTIDAVPVVRCKDCKHRPIKPDDYDPITTDGFVLEFPDGKCPCQCGDGWYSKYPNDDWYCPIGERKGGEE